MVVVVVVVVQCIHVVLKMNDKMNDKDRLHDGSSLANMRIVHYKHTALYNCTL